MKVISPTPCPVSQDKLLWSKILVFWTWSAIDFLCVALSILILTSYPETMQDILDGFQLFFTSLLGFEGFNAMTNAIAVTLGLIAEYFFYMTSLILFSICLGSLFMTHKSLGAVVSFFRDQYRTVCDHADPDVYTASFESHHHRCHH